MRLLDLSKRNVHFSQLIYILLLSYSSHSSTASRNRKFVNTSLDLSAGAAAAGTDNSTLFTRSTFNLPQNDDDVDDDNFFTHFEDDITEHEFGRRPILVSSTNGTRVVLWDGDGPEKEMYGKQIIFGNGGNGWSSGGSGGAGGGGGWGQKNGGKKNGGGGGGWSSGRPSKGGGSNGGGGGYNGLAGKGTGGRGPPVPNPPSLPIPVEPAPSVVFCAVKDKCFHFVHCASHLQTYLKEKERCCQITYEAKGMCCVGLPTGPSLTEYDDDEQTELIGNHFRPYSTAVVKIHPISIESLYYVADKAYEYKDVYHDIETQILEQGIVVKEGTSAYGHLQFFQTTPAILNIGVENILVLKATGHLQDKFFLTPSQAGVGLQAYGFTDTVLGKTCPASPTCNEYARKYRTADGSCNNFNTPKLGQSGTPLLRLLPPDYADGIWSPRVRRDGGALPSPRYISQNLVPDMDIPDLRYSHLLMQFGQFVDHDLTHVPIFRLRDLSGIECCGSGQGSGQGGNGGSGGGGGGGGYGRKKRAARKQNHRRHFEEEGDGDDDDERILQHPACFPIPLDPNDPKFGGRTCMNFVRSLVAPRLECTFGHADQLNQVTHWLDGSQIYGSTYEKMEQLREFQYGLLKVTRDPNGRQLLPVDLNDIEDCVGSSRSSGGAGLHCFVAGDRRVNEQIALATVHTIWIREHNRIATDLRFLHGDWDDEILYQETRRIVIAEYQHIIYNEWLPIIIGRRYMAVFNILPYAEGYYTAHDVLTDPTVSNAFATAAFRLHTLVSGWFDLNDENTNTVSRLPIRNFFNNPHILREPGTIDGLTKGLLTQPIQRFDPYVTTELRDHLFETGTNDGIGMDLVALNIQRGRDHGLPSYNEYRDLCRLGKARSFAELAPIIPFYKTEQLQKIYSNVDDIDLFIGGIHETPAEGALVGPTFLCIIGDQFARLKKSDRYFYDVGGTPHSFTKAQLYTIRRVSMARIICDNTEEIRSIQPLAFHLPNNGYNPIFPCGSPSIPRLDLSAWA